MYVHHTIVAPATAPGTGAIGIIRLCGQEAFVIADLIFSGKKLSVQPTHTLHYGKIVDGEKAVDEVLAAVFHAPGGFTGEDMIEFSCHGSEYILREVMALCIRHGAAPAQPGEFTRRAFLNGKLDLTQAEAVADLIASQSDAARNAALYQLKGGFSRQLKDMREQLIQFSALIELELDFSQEDVEFADRPQLYALITTLMQATRQLLDSFSLGNVIRNGVKVAIIGRPNAGKSTLLNVLLNEERAIVSDIPGTTRDTIEDTLNINGILFRLVDTAGIRESSDDIIENIGMERSRKAMQEADIVICLFDVADTPESVAVQLNLAAGEGKRFIPVGNKVDIPGMTTSLQRFAGLPEDKLFISAKEQQHISLLKEKLFEIAAGGQLKQEGAVVTNARHYAALTEVHHSLSDILAGLDNHLPGDLIALDIRRSLHYLGAITGEITTEDKLDYIFSKFCIGK